MTLLLLVLIVLLTLLSIPAFVIFFRARKNNVNLDLGKAFIMQLRKTGSNEMFKAYAGFVKNGMKNITLDDIEAHVLAGGNPMNCLEGYIYAKEQGLNPEYKVLTAIDLSGRNVKDDFIGVNQEHDIKIQTLDKKSITLDYYVRFRFTHSNLFQIKDINLVKENIKKKLGTFLNSWNGNDLFEAERLIRENILNPEYFERNLGIQVLKQDYVLKRIK